MLFKSIQWVEEQQWRQRMAKKPKLRTYTTFKKKLELEKYLLSGEREEGEVSPNIYQSGYEQVEDWDTKVEETRWKDTGIDCAFNVVVGW